MKDESPAHNADARPTVRGKFIFAGEEKFYARGVTYGTFAPSPEGDEFPVPDVVERDFQLMALNAINTVRTYTVPPRWLLDAARRHGLRVLAGMDWADHQEFLSTEKERREIERRVRNGVLACMGHPALLGFAIGNEIPASLVRWYGARRVEAFIEALYSAAKQEDPQALVTYVNFPSTEFLELPFLDWVGFNVYLESQTNLAAYLAKLQNVAGERPLVMTELGLDSRRHCEVEQAHSLTWQIETSFAQGCAGAFVYSWTDEWHRGGSSIEEWDFGLTTREREPKAALEAVRSAFGRVPFPCERKWPRISVVVCSYNGGRTIEDCLEGISQLDYPDFETIVVNDGSTDAVPEIASRFDVRLISTENRGLSSARNTGLAASTGEIVAYIDDDARPDPDWLRYLAWKFETTDHAGVGGPNIAPPGDGPIAECVANAPGGPIHVLLSDDEAEHIPGCNMAFQKEALESIGGFDPRFRTAGDDVDVCWRITEAGGTLGFHAGAMVWHHRRNSVRTYWRQQVGYGRAEALLEEKWPERYNRTGHVSWGGRIYARGRSYLFGPVQRIYHGTWGSAPFQSMYQSSEPTLWSLARLPEWYLVIVACVAAALVGILWQPLLVIALPAMIVAVALPMVLAVDAARSALFRDRQVACIGWKLRIVIFSLHLLQPLARLHGRLSFGLTPWRGRIASLVALPLPRRRESWTGHWQSPEQELRRREEWLRATGGGVRRGGPHDGWDMEVRGGMFATARLLLAVEEHGDGVQHWLMRTWPHLSKAGILVTSALIGLFVLSIPTSGVVVSLILGIVLALLVTRVAVEAAAAAGALAACEDSLLGDEPIKVEGASSAAL